MAFTSDNTDDDNYTPVRRQAWHALRRTKGNTRGKMHVNSSALSGEYNGFDSDGSVDSDEEMKDAPPSVHSSAHATDWSPGNEDQCGCNMLEKILRVFGALRWNPNETTAPFPNCVILGLALMLKHVSEGVMDLLLDVLRWWQERNVNLQDIDLPENAKKLKRQKQEVLPDMGQFIGLCFFLKSSESKVRVFAESVTVPDTPGYRGGTFYYVSPFVLIAMDMLTPVTLAMMEHPQKPSTWRRNSIWNTNWVKQWSHITAPSSWGVVHDGTNGHFVSQGSVIQRDDKTFVLERLLQRPRRPFRQLTFGQLSKFKPEDVEGRLWILVHEIEMVNGHIQGKLGEKTWRLLSAASEWKYLGQVETFTQESELNLPQSASGMLEECSDSEQIFLLGMNMDACGPYKFSKTLTGTHMLYLRSWTMRASYRHFGFPCAAVPNGMDPSLALGMLGRDISIIERGDIYTVKACTDGIARWQKIFCHLANFVSDREGSDNALGRIHAGAKTKSEWKGFLGWRHGFGLGPRADGNHEFGGNARYFRTVCICTVYAPSLKYMLRCSTSILFMKGSN